MPSVDSVELNSNDSITPAMDFQFGRQRIRNNISTKSDGILLLSSDVLSTETNREIIPAAALQRVGGVGNLDPDTRPFGATN